MDVDEKQARERAAGLCRRLRDRGDALSLEAAAEIEGTLEAFAVIVTASRRLAQRQRETDDALRITRNLWDRVPVKVRSEAAAELAAATFAEHRARRHAP